jgi:hypothetical protein
VAEESLARICEFGVVLNAAMPYEVACLGGRFEQIEQQILELQVR